MSYLLFYTFCSFFPVASLSLGCLGHYVFLLHFLHAKFYNRSLLFPSQALASFTGPTFLHVSIAFPTFPFCCLLLSPGPCLSAYSFSPPFSFYASVFSF